MPRSRKASDPISFHSWTGQYYTTRGGKRVYLGSDHDEALQRFYRLALAQSPEALQRDTEPITCKELANRFLAAQEANWRNPATTSYCYKDWLHHFLADHEGLLAAEFTVEMFAGWKLSLRRRKYSAKSINHYLGVVRSMFKFGEDTGLIVRAPRLNRVKMESLGLGHSIPKALYTPAEVQILLATADLQMKAMLLLSINCGFGPKDIHDLTWSSFDGNHVMLARSKTGVGQAFILWPETLIAIGEVRSDRSTRLARAAKRGRQYSDGGRVFMTKYWRPWNKDAVSEQFRKLCNKSGVPCYGFYRLRHGASTAVSLVALPHVQRKFMRHAQLQQQVTYTHTPDTEVDAAVMAARVKLLGRPNAGQESNHGQGGVA
ncbi:MAG TPA: site-specific integrase [Phycisphaerae bacterium]|nr:site-specific integrase [Phycisphaerae bacterium]